MASQHGVGRAKLSMTVRRELRSLGPMPDVFCVLIGMTSLVVAPQLAYLVKRGQDVSLPLMIGLAVLIGLGLGLVDLLALRLIALRGLRAPDADQVAADQGSDGSDRGMEGSPVGRACVRWICWLHLPLLGLWLPWLSATGGIRPRAHLMLLLPVVALWVIAFLARAARSHAGVVPGVVVGCLVVVLGLGLGLVGQELVRAGVAGLLLALLWAGAILLAFVGWGAVVNRLLLPESRLDWGQQAALGLAVTLAAGGLLNLTWSVSLVAVVLWVAAGVGVVASRLGSVRAEPVRGSRRQLRPWLADWMETPGRVIVVVIVVLMATLQLTGAVCGSIDTARARPIFDLHDDAQGYLVFVEKMIALGSMGPEPFGGRRMLSLGGQPFLQALVRAVLPIERIHLIDAGIAPLILLGLVLGAGRRHRLGRGPTLVLVLVTLCLPHLQMRGNTSSMMTSMVLLVSWFRLLWDRVLPDDPGPRPAALIALIAGGLCVLKSVFMPAAVTMLVVSGAVLLLHQRRRRAVMLELAGTLGGVAGLMLPWMLSVLASSGTLLYPVLSQGFYGGVYTQGFASITGDLSVSALAELEVIVGQLAPLLPLLLLLALVREKGSRGAVVAVVMAALVNVVAVVVLGEPSLNRAMSRYRFPMQSVALICLSLACFESSRRLAGARTLLAPAAAVAVAALTAVGLEGRAAAMYRQLLGRTAAAVEGEIFADETTRRATARLQQAIPEGATALASLGHPYLLDLARNPVHVMALPGMSSPPPGLPIDDGAEAVSDFLLQRGTRYVAYGGMATTLDLLDLSEEQINARYPKAKVRWVMLRYHQRYRAVVQQLAHGRRRLYEDGRRVVLDLATPACTVIPRFRSASAPGFRQGVWADSDVTLDLSECALGDRAPTVVVVRTMGWAPVQGGAERHRLRLVLDGVPLEYEAQLDQGYLFRVPPLTTKSKPRELRMLSRQVPSAAAGAIPGGPGLGIDVDRFELLADETGLGEPVVRPLQTMAGELDPLAVSNRVGWYQDFGWTSGDAVLDDLAWPVDPRDEMLVLELSPVMPAQLSPELPEAIGGRAGGPEQGSGYSVRVLVNEVELARVSCQEDESVEMTLCFALYHGIESIERVRLISSTFVPSDLGPSDDHRTLGIPVRRISLRGTAGAE